MFSAYFREVLQHTSAVEVVVVEVVEVAVAAVEIVTCGNSSTTSRMTLSHLALLALGVVSKPCNKRPVSESFSDVLIFVGTFGLPSSQLQMLERPSSLISS